MPAVANSVESRPEPTTKTAEPRFLRNIGSNWGGYAFTVVVGFFLSPYVVSHLGNEGYGVWSLLISLTGYLALLDLGVRGAVTRYVARFRSTGDHVRSSELASSAMAIFSATGIAAVAISGLLALFVIGRMKIPVQYMLTARVVLLLVGVSVALSLVNGVFGGILVGLQRFDLTNGIETGITGIRAAVTLVALHQGFGLLTMAGIQLVCALARLAASSFFAYRLYPELRVRAWFANRENLRLIASFSSFSFLLHVSASLIYASDLVVIGAYLPMVAVTFYAIGANLVEYARALVSGISQTMTPFASSMDARRDESGLQAAVLRCSGWASMAILPVTITFFLRGSSFIELWMGPQYGEVSGQVLRILTMSVALCASSSVVVSTMLGISRHKPLVPVAIAEGLCNLVLSIFLIKRFGIVGVALGTLIPSLLNSALFVPWYLHRTLGVHPRRYIAESWLKPALASVPFALLSYATQRFWPAHNLFLFFLQIALCLPLVLVCYWEICLTSGQRVTYLRKLSATLGRTLSRPVGEAR